MCIYFYIYIYVYTCICMSRCIHIHIFTSIYRLSRIPLETLAEVAVCTMRAAGGPQASDGMSTKGPFSFKEGSSGEDIEPLCMGDTGPYEDLGVILVVYGPQYGPTIFKGDLRSGLLCWRWLFNGVISGPFFEIRLAPAAWVFCFVFAYAG